MRRAPSRAPRTRCRAPARRSTSPASPTSAARSPSVSDSGFGFTQNVAQVNNSTTLLKGNHAFKAGFDVQWVEDTRVAPQAVLYTFPNIAAYQAARSGENRLGYTSFTQYFGLPDLAYNTSQYGLFVQDDWRVSSDLKVLYGVRYDLFAPPDADAERAGGDLARVLALDQQLRAARRRGVDARREPPHRAARQHRRDVRPDAQRDLRAVAAERRHQRARVGVVHADPGRRAGVPGGADRRLGRDAEPRLDRRSRLQGGAVVAEQRAVRARLRRSLFDLGRHART